jgi:O-antigen/teichoic acid export membrane protein
MSLKIEALKNVGSSWFGWGVNILVGFFLSPYILHRLGDEAFGLWVLVFSLTGYYGVFDLGIRSSIIKYVAQYSASNDQERLTGVINTALFVYSCIAVVLLFATAVISVHVDRLFRVTPDFLPAARMLCLIVGAAVAVGFPLAVFGGILQGLQRFTWLNLTQVVSTLLRALCIVLALRHGGGLLAVALITVLLPIGASLFYIVAVQWLAPIRLGRRYVNRASFRLMMSYGSVTFLIVIAEQLRFQSDAVIIGIFLPASAITFFAIGSKLADYAIAPVHSMADIFLPMASHFDASRDMGRLRQVLLEGNRFCAFTMFPICVMVIVLGKELIEVWVGPKYVSSYVILLLLLVPKALYRAQAASTRLLFGIARHRPLAIAAMMEGIANVLLSILLIRPMGIVGDALGTTIPLLVTSVLFLPLYLCRLLEVPLKTFLGQSYLPPLALCVPLAGTLLFLHHGFPAHTYVQLLVQVAAGALVYGVGLCWFFLTREPMGVKLWKQFSERFSGAA